MSKLNEIESLELSARDLGKILALTDRQIRNLADDGIIIRGDARGRFKLHPSAANYVKHLASRETPASERLSEERARGQRLSNDIREGKLVPVEVADGQLQEIMGIVISAVNGLPVRIAGNRKARAQIEMIERIIDQMKGEIVRDIGKLQAQFEAEASKHRAPRLT